MGLCEDSWLLLVEGSSSLDSETGAKWSLASKVGLVVVSVVGAWALAAHSWASFLGPTAVKGAMVTCFSDPPRMVTTDAKDGSKCQRRDEQPHAGLPGMDGV